MKQTSEHITTASKTDDKRLAFEPVLSAGPVRLLDLCCKAGGCSFGYKQAADDLGLEIEIVGVDIEEQPNYPFQFIQADAVEFLKENWRDFTHVHASPPCQNYTTGTAVHRAQGKEYRDNLAAVRETMILTGLPGVIENVPTAPVRPDIVLRGDMFGLKVLRKRHFELVNWWAMNPVMPYKIGSVKEGDYAQVFGKGQLKGSGKGNKPVKIPGTVNEVWSIAMGIDWMTNIELAEAIPPAFTRYVGQEWFRACR